MILCYDQLVRSTGRGSDGARDVDLTVDQLARLAGTTTRNVRALQTLGLLPRPTLRGRTGLYGQEHLDRLKAVLRLQRAGFSLSAVGALFEAWEQGLTLEEVLGVPASPVGDRPVADHGPDDVDAFADWPARGAAGAVAVIPTTVLEQVAS
jgi:DNA-binding transcriptional MerR regulator